MEKELRRKMDSYLLEWKQSPIKKPLIVKGARQIGKTYSIRKFGRTYNSFIEINFIDNPEYKDIFENGYNPDAIIKRISFHNPLFQFIPGNTLIFFDELQEFPDASTSLKFFAEDGRFDVICSGSMMGINFKRISSNSVGYKTDYEMHSLDFEEFLWSKGYDDSFIEDLYSHLKEQKPFSDSQLNQMNDFFLEYATIGGMPAIIKQFNIDGTFSNIPQLQKQLLIDYEQDITKYAEGIDKTKIKNIYHNISTFLAKDNKKFQITKIAKNARSRDYIGCTEWLQDAGIINLSYALRDIDFPLKGNFDASKYKVYFHDTGLLIASLDEESADDLRRNMNLGTYKGGIYENIVSQMLVSENIDLYYYQKENSQMEIDFITRTTDSIVPIEVKAQDGATVSLNNMINSDKYSAVRFGIKLSKKNIGFNGKFYTIPYFCTFLLKRFLKEEFVVATNHI